jgi:hypothetical protein
MLACRAANDARNSSPSISAMALSQPIREIILEPWQQEIVETAPWPFIRGCIKTDCCAFINRTDVHRARPYEYLSYDFSNMSTDIVELVGPKE